MSPQKHDKKPVRVTPSKGLARSIMGGVAVLLTLFGSAPASAATSSDSPLPNSKGASITERVKLVRERLAAEAQKGEEGSPPLYRLAQWFNFPNFPNFQNFPNFPNFNDGWGNFSNFPNFRNY